MKYQYKKRVFNLCVTAPVLLVPLIAFVAIGLETGLLPKFWELIYTELPQSDENPLYFVYMRQAFGMVGMLESTIFSILRNLIPLLSGIVVIPMIRMRDSVFQLARPRWKHEKRAECRMIVQTVLLSGCVIFLGYLLTMACGRWMFHQVYVPDESGNVFVNDVNLPLDDGEHPYLYLLALGAMRCFLLPMLMALLTIAVSYLTNRVYLYLLVPTLYMLLGSKLLSQGMTQDKWPLPLFSPENFIWPKGALYWGYGHEASFVWGMVCAALLVIVPSVAMIWYGMRRRRV